MGTALHDAGRLVSVVNPTRIKYAGLMCGRGNKSDTADARQNCGNRLCCNPRTPVPRVELSGHP